MTVIINMKSDRRITNKQKMDSHITFHNKTVCPVCSGPVCVEVLSGPVCVEVLSGSVCVCVEVLSGPVCVCGGIEWTSVCVWRY